MLLCQENSITYFRDHFTVILRSILFNAKAEILPVSPERLDRIYFLLRQLQGKNVIDLVATSDRLNASSRAIRRDLEIMQQQGWITSVGTTSNKTYYLTEKGLERLKSLS